MTTGIFRPASSFTAILLLVLVVPVSAATYLVNVSDAGFFPAELQIVEGDTVVWINDDEDFPHTTTSDLSFLDPNYWNGVLVDYEDTFARTFTQSGTFTYRDQLGPGRGTIIVTAGGGPVPEITLESSHVAAGRFRFTSTGLTVGRETVLEFSTNLTHWTPLRTNVAESSSMTFTNDLDSGAAFFRVHQLP